jgi:hypothetical protein
MPISLAAWFETIGHVSLLGSYQTLNPDGGSGCGQHALPDPLVILPLSAIVDCVERNLEYDKAAENEVLTSTFEISPDDLHKADVSGDAYYVDLPDAGMDVVFKDWSGDMFVDYLRRVFKWGGFPGLERSSDPPLDLIRELTRDLLPL